MAIKDPLMFITIEEFKNWKGFNKLEFDDTTTPDNEIWFAISVASNNIDYLSGFEISKKWPETTLTEFTDEIQTATAYYVRFLLTKDSNYIRGQSSISQGGMTYSENNPTDPYFIVPEVFNCLRKIKEYPNITGFNLDVLPKRNYFFSNFYSNCGEDSPLTRYLELINLKTNDTRVKIYPKNPKHLIGTQLWIDTTGIKSFDNLTTIELFTKYFSNDSMKLVNGKEGQEKKVISATGGNSLWEVNKDNSNFINSKDDKGISANDKRIIDVGTPTFETDSTNKVYVDTLLDKKQNKLIAGTNITIDENNKISATGGSADLSDYYKKEEVDKKLEDKMNKEQFQYAFAINTIGTKIPNLETTNKTIAGAINEILKTKQEIIDLMSWTKYFNNDYFEWKDNKLIVDTNPNSSLGVANELLKINTYGGSLKTSSKSIFGAINELALRVDDLLTRLTNDEQNMINKEKWKEVGTKININHIKHTFKSNTKYKIYYNFESQSSIKKFAFMSKEFLYGELNTDVQTLYWDKVNDRIMVSLQMQNDTIAIVSDPVRYGQLLKLEELQE
ncbi:hypothetical protein [Spiroplasma endosymbiont of Colias croceus]|uniref:hypothetical protein n=1 Tax=Spiroplasma endosymbiont of Colias croceus TaxID=3066310 RepID=UPI0030CB80F8